MPCSPDATQGTAHAGTSARDPSPQAGAETTGVAEDVAAARRAGPTTIDLILDRALDRFSSVGYDGTSVREIAQLVGIKAASLYNHFESKEEILWTIVNKGMHALDTLQEQSPDGARTHADRLRSFVRTHVRFHATYSREARIANLQSYSLDFAHFAQASDFRRRYERLLETIIREGIAAGAFRASDARLASHAILQMGTGVAFWFRPDGQMSVGQLCAAYELFAIRMVGADAAPPTW